MKTKRIQHFSAYMRPSKSIEGKELYECFECGARVKQPETRVCETCGGKLQNIGQSRDL